MKKIDYFKDDVYWRLHINKQIEDDMWIDEYNNYFFKKGKCLDLGAGIGQYTKRLIQYGYDVVSADISDIALNEIPKFNKNIRKIDMREKLPFDSDEFDLVFANLSIHYFSDNDTKKLICEIKRILKNDGLFIGSVNGIQGYNVIKDIAKEIEYHYWFSKDKYIRLFDENDLRNYLKVFQIIELGERETIRFNHNKNYLIFVCKNKK